MEIGKIGVLMGGPSTEREISFKSGKAVFAVLKEAGLDAVPIDIETDDKEKNISLIKSYHIDCAFLALHGRFGEDGTIQEILQGIRMPYTGSGVKASKLAMDKIASRKIFAQNNLPVPRYKLLAKDSYNPDYISENNFSLPAVIKPATHGSSIGLSIIEHKNDLTKAAELAFQFDERVIIEEYLKGREVTVGILDRQALPVIEIIPKKRFFDYEAKYTNGMTDYIAPAQLPDSIAKMIQAVALSADQLLDCYGCSRVDMILGENGIPYILEVNSIPGMTENSLLPKAARICGIDFTRLCLRLIELAYEKTKV
ncbi:MAG: D-alanine--D-alanine ligase [Candidatus Omnitrophica bacterium]|nr:D-alanine--D-alanine ligase [Candidatus Omnitrophota bacterium]